VEYFYKYGTTDTVTADTLTADTLIQEIFNFPARRQRAVKCKMALTSQQRGWCVLEFHKTNSVVTVQRAFKRKFNVDPPTNKSILKWHRNFIERGCICDQRKGHSGWPSVSEQLSTRSRRILLQRVRSELDYRIDFCRVTRGGHIECVWYHMKLYQFMQL